MIEMLLSWNGIFASPSYTTITTSMTYLTCSADQSARNRPLYL